MLPALALAQQAKNSPAPPVYPFGAVYFRKSNPPAADWERDHAVAAQLGINAFRHWFMWSAIETSPDHYDWRDYDRMVELEAKNHLRVVIAELVTGAPEWMWNRYPHARCVDAHGQESYPYVGVSSATGNAPLCLDDEEVRARAEKFLTALVLRYRDNPAVLGYDLWNESSMPDCYCPATAEKFREWLRAKYGTIAALENAWHRYSLGDWGSVLPPRRTDGYPDSLDWLQFHRDDEMRLLRWRTDLIRRLDPKHEITAHGTGNYTEIEWRAAAAVDCYGYTWVASRHGNAPWMQFRAVDLVRGAAGGKPFWHAEATGGPLWLQPQVLNRPLADGRSSDAQDVRVWSLIDMAAGARGIFFTRWRPLLDGPLFGAFGPMGMDGSVTPRAEMAGRLARWANAHPAIWRSRPVRGDVGLLFLQEALDLAAIQEAAGAAASPSLPNNYTRSLEGAYRAFFDAGVQADFASLDDIGRYPLIYVPYPIRLTARTAAALGRYLAGGGKVVCEGCPGYFGEGGTAGTVQPNLGLDRLFGARETYVQFTQDLLRDLAATVLGKPVNGQFFLQEYALAGGAAAGTFADGKLAAVEHAVGRGKSLLIGTFPGGGYERHPTAENRAFFAGLLPWAGVRPRLECDRPEVEVRLHEGAGGTYLWIVNPSRKPLTVTVSLGESHRGAETLWPEGLASVLRPEGSGSRVTAQVGERDAAVLRLF